MNAALTTTLIVASNAYKYVAQVETDLGDIPNVECHIGDINQVFLNLVVNASHAVEERFGRDPDRGKISISSRCEGDNVIVVIEDNGTGIDPAIRDRVFDPFFTTKEVGKGTGQGLAIAHAAVVDRHCGELVLDSAEGSGTTFTISIPIASGGAKAGEQS